MRLICLIAGIFLCAVSPGCKAQPAPFYTGAEQMQQYLPLLKGKRVGVLINQTSQVGASLLADTLLASGINVKTIFVPEHGFRGTADAGAHVDNTKDEKTSLPVISLYGSNKKPTPLQMTGIDVLVYDLQDVGVRFYTYISTLQYAMEACAETGKPLIVLDRANPHAGYISGPMLEPAFRSFIGMQPVPVVYGMTAGEYARMLKGEGWFVGAKRLNLTVIPCAGYNRDSVYPVPVSPSPNLRSLTAIRLYPSICFFEGTPVSLGRGTDRPFEVWGHPSFRGLYTFSFTPRSTVGATNPPLKDQTCFGMDAGREGIPSGRLRLDYLLQAYRAYPAKDSFFTPFFAKLAGTNKLRDQIIQGKTAAEIEASWAPDLQRFNTIRKKYLLYTGKSGK